MSEGLLSLAATITIILSLVLQLAGVVALIEKHGPKSVAALLFVVGVAGFATVCHFTL